MIFDALILIGNVVVVSLAKLLSLIVIQLPVKFISSITYFVSHLLYARGFFPINELFQAMGVYLIFLGGYYTFKLLRWAFALSPWIGKSVGDPTIRKKITYSR